jgi:hypothetical protein
MAGYTKLFSSIVNSTIWREENHVRLVWITMLALADKNGLVEASIPGLADAARVTIKECENALDKLMSPDEYSRSQENEGKRIAKEDGGWLLLNYVRYRGKLTQEKIREQNRIRQQRFRDKKRNVTVTHNGDVTPINAQSESESESQSKASKKKTTKKKAVQLPQEWKPSNGHHELARKLGVNIEWEADQMRDWAISKGESKKDWDAAFRNWIRREALRRAMEEG